MTALPVTGEPETEFEFKLYVDVTPPKNDMLPMIIGIVVGILVVLIICCAIIKIRKNKSDNTVQVLAQESVDDHGPVDKTDNDDMNTIDLVKTNKEDGDK